jgi:hypothetical protein
MANRLYSSVYEKRDSGQPVSKLALIQGGEGEGTASSPADEPQGLIVALDLLLLPMARTQTKAASRSRRRHPQVLDGLQQEWSEA